MTDRAMQKIFDMIASRAISAAAVVTAATISAAHLIEKAGYPPCTLCLYQRVPYYIALGLFALAALVIRMPGARRFQRPFILVLVALFVVSGAMGVFHAGVEFALWDGPRGCSGSLDTSNMETLLETLRNTKAVSCTKASFWIFGLSLSVWNAVVSFTLAGALSLALSIRRSN